MNRKQFVVLLVLVVALGAVGITLHRRNQASWQNSSPSLGTKLLPNLPVNDVASIVVKAATNELDLVKTDKWRVAQRYNYLANYGDIRNFLVKATELKAAQTEELGPSQRGRFKLQPPGPAADTGVLVEFKDQSGKLLASLLLGKEHRHKTTGAPPMGEGDDTGSADGRYVMVGTNSTTVAVLSDPLGNMDVKPEQWLNKDFFKVEKIRSISLTSTNATNSWSVSRETESSSDWKLADAKPGELLDSAKTSSFSYALSSPTFADVLPADAPAAVTGLDKPTVLKIETFDNFSYMIDVGAKTNDSYAVKLAFAADIPKERTAPKDEKPEEKEKAEKDFKEKQKKLEDKLAEQKPLEKWIYLVSTWTLEPLLKDRSQLFAEKKDETKKEEGKDEQPTMDDKSAGGLMSILPPLTNLPPVTNAAPVTNPPPAQPTK